MKAQILKIAGVKSEKEFYKKYPSEEAFMKKHGKEFKKAQFGTYIGGDTNAAPKMINFSDSYDSSDEMVTGSTGGSRQEAAYKQAMLDATASKGGGGAPAGGGAGGMDMGSMMGMMGGEGEEGGSGGGMDGIMSMFGGEGGGGEGGGGFMEMLGGMFGGGAKYGANIPKAQGGQTLGAVPNYYNNNATGFQTNYQQPQQTYAGPQQQPVQAVGSNLQPAGLTQLPQQQGPSAPMPTEQDLRGVPEEDTGLGKKLGGLTKLMGPVGGIIEGIDALKGEQEAVKRAEQMRQLSALTLKASTTRPEQKERKYVRPEDVANTGEAFFPVYGVGTNVLARNGIRLQDGGGVEDRPGGMMGREPIIPEVDAVTPIQEKPSNFDSKSARDNWVQKTGLPWSEAKRLGYTSGTAKDNTKLLGELNDPRFKKENLRSAPVKNSSQARTPIQHRETPTGRLTPIKNAIQTYDDFFKGKPKYKGNNAMLSADTRTQEQREKENKRQQAEHDDYLLGERALYYLANPSKAFGDLKSVLNPSGTTEDETSEGFRKQVMANRYDPRLTDKERSARHRQMGYGLVPKATANAAALISAAPYSTFEPMAIGIGEGAAPRAAGYLGQGARQIGQGAARQLGQGAPKAIAQGYVPNFTMYQDGGSIGGNPTEIQNTYGNGNSIYDDLEYSPLIDEDQQKSFYYGGGIPKAQNGMQNWQNSMGGGGSGFSGAADAGSGGGTPWGAIGHQATGIGQGIMGGQNAGGKIGGTAGKAIGSIWGPVGGAIGEFAGGMIGNAVDTNAKDIKKKNEATQKNIQNQAYNQMGAGIQAGYASHMKDGGYMNPTYNPQVIAMFGDHNADDFADYAHKFRAGGHLKEYTAPSERAMQTYKNGGGVKSHGLGGELETHWGGGAETISQNPYLPGTGETVMFRGKSHEERSPNGETGIGVTYGGNPVEVERGEPMVELEEGGEIDPETGEPQKSGVVFGNLKIPNQYLDLLGDKSAKGKKFKNYVNDLSKSEAKHNKAIEKSTNELNSLDVSSSFDRLKLSALQANINGSNMKLKEIADKKINAAHLQNAINDTAEENGLVADDLARGKVKMNPEAMQTREARWGDAISKAQEGKKLKFKSDKEALEKGYTKDADGKYYKITPAEKREPVETKIAEAQKDVPLQHKDASGIYGGAAGKLAQMQRNNPWFKWEGFNPANKADVERFQKAFNERAKSIGSSAKLTVDGKYGDQTASAVIDEHRKVQPSVGTREEAEVETEPTKPVPYKRSGLIDFGNQILDYLRPSNQEPLDPNQLMGEMFAMSNNQLEPVQAQLYKPEIGVPYDISYQDQLNENQADYNSTQRLTGYNPAALANLNAQKYQANQRVLAEQFRANQAMKDKVYGENRNVLNQAKATNLGILDKQYERQSEALSNTKATAQAAINSISDKYAKNKLENRELGIYENLYKYRYDNKGRAINLNGLFQPNIGTVGSGNATQKQVPMMGADGKVYLQLQEMTPEEIALQKQEQDGDSPLIPSLSTGGINGNAQTKTKKRNGSIVKAIKNL